MDFSIIVATDINNGIGFDVHMTNSFKLPWKCPHYSEFFKKLTLNSAVIMGKNTLLSLPNPNNDFKYKKNIVLTTQPFAIKNKDIHCVTSIDDALEYCKENNYNKIFVIGGQSVYKQAFINPNLTKIYWNIIPESYNQHKLNIFLPINFIQTMNDFNMIKSNINDVVCYEFTKKSLIQNTIINKVNREEMQYLNICRKILNEGTLQEGRNGFTKSIFGTSMRFSLQNNKIPIFTTKKVAWKTCLKELLWFISGDNSDNNVLRDQNVHIWDGNSTRKYLDSIGLDYFDENELGSIYGYQWRHFNQTYIPKKYREEAKLLNYDSNKGIEQICDDIDQIYNMQYPNEPYDYYTQKKADYLKNNIKQLKKKVEFMSCFQPKKDIDQLQYIIDCLKDPVKRFSRRLIMSAFNPCQFDQMVLPPCHVMAQFDVKNNNKLSCILFQRSSDGFLGKCFNTCSYSLLTHLLAQHCGLEAHEFIHYVGNDHIYDDHFEQMEEQLKREPYEFPTLEIQSIKENINDYTVDDFKINNYQYHPQIKAKMRA